jgi:2-methylcitrate dehydratase PrpD
MSGEATPVQILARFAADCRDNGLPPAVAEDIAGRVLDVLGNCVAGKAESHAADEPDAAVLRFAAAMGGTAESSVIGSTDRLPAANAALVNGTLAHALDFDDTHLPSVLHPSASVVPAALAVGEAVNASGADLAAAIAAGIEITNRLGMASYDRELRNSTFFEKGFHATSICGTFGAAVAAGLLWGLDADQLAHAMGIAASMGAGVIEANRTGGSVKRIHCGWAAHGGVVAAALAREGVTGPPTVLEGRFGFFFAYLDGTFDSEAMLGELGTRWETLRTVYKPYPSNHFTHPGIDCALALRAGGLDPADIGSVELGVSDKPFRTIGEPREQKIHPQTAYHAKFSGPYTVASALLGGGGLGVYLDDFTEAAFTDPARIALAEKVTVVVDERATEIFPEAFAAVLRVTTTDGRVLEHRVDSSRGSEEHPLSRDEHRLKFRLNAARALSDEQVSALDAAVVALLDGAPEASIGAVMALTRA